MKLINFALIIFAMLNTNVNAFSQIQYEKADSIKHNIVKKELALFCQGSTSFRDSHNLVEILPYFCSDSMVHFYVGSTYITIKAKEIIQEGKRVKVLDEMNVIVHSNFKIKIDDSDLMDIKGINFYHRDDSEKVTLSNWCKLMHWIGFCDQKYKSSPYYKVFYSDDKRRFYIYLLLGQENQQEVVWIFYDNKYFGRVVKPFNTTK